MIHRSLTCICLLYTSGGYHGKSTLLNALELGVYNHIQGDGREYVITDPTAQKLRSEDGRFVKDVDISPVSYTHLDVYKRQRHKCFFLHQVYLVLSVEISIIRHYSTEV